MQSAKPQATDDSSRGQGTALTQKVSGRLFRQRPIGGAETSEGLGVMGFAETRISDGIEIVLRVGGGVVA